MALSEIPLRAENKQIARRQPAGVDRRTALRMLTATPLALNALLRGETAQAAELDKTSQLIAHREQLEKAGFLTIDYDPAKEGKGLYAHSVLKPSDWKVTPVMIEKQVNGRCAPNARFWVPVPRDIFDQGHIATDPKVMVDGKELHRISPDERRTANSYSAEIVYSESTRQNPHKNPFVCFQVNARVQQGMSLVVGSWILQPEYAGIDKQQITEELARQYADQYRVHPQQALLKARQVVASTPLSQLVVTNSRGFAGVSNQVSGALSKASALRYNAGNTDVSPGCWRAGHGDCGTKAATAKHFSGGNLEFLGGFSNPPDSQHLGRHCITAGVVAGGAFVADPGSNGQIEIGPPSADYVTTQVGEYTNVKYLDRDYAVYNGGGYSGTGVPKGGIVMAGLSTTSGGVNQVVVNQVAQNGPKDVVKQYADWRRGQRAEVYEGTKLAVK